MALRRFENDDAGYEAWLAAHPSGWVVNAGRRPSAAYLKLHEAQCPTISQLRAGYSRWTTGEYIKVCAEHRKELDDWAQQNFGVALQDGCHCVQHGGRTRRASPAAVRMPSATAVADSPHLVELKGFSSIETATLIAFEPTDPRLLRARSQLRSMLDSLTAQPGELLHGIIEGPAVAGTDLDNALLYNIGGSVDAAARYGVALECRVARSSSASTRYRYRIAHHAEIANIDGEPVAEFDEVPLSRPPRAWHEIWAAVRTSNAVSVLRSAPVGELALYLRRSTEVRGCRQRPVRQDAYRRRYHRTTCPRRRQHRASSRRASRQPHCSTSPRHRQAAHE